MTEILLVADEPWVVNDVTAALADQRYSITHVADPRRVVAHLAAGPTDLVIADMQTGTMGAMAVTRAIRAADGDTAPPVVVLLDRDSDGFLARRAGAAAWVRKPFGSAELRSIVDGLLAVAEA